MPQMKYHSRRITIGGETFDSKREYQRYLQLQELETAGEIAELERQRKFVLLPSQRDPETGKTLERPVVYIADFAYRTIPWNVLVVEDAKGVRTPDYVIKRKLMLYIHGIRVKEV